MTLDETLDFRRNLAIVKRTMPIGLGNAKKRDFIENKLEKDNDQGIAFGMDGVKCTQMREDMILLRSSISKSLRLYN